MVQPIDYLGMLPRVDLGESLMQGLQLGQAIKDVRAENQQQDMAQQYANDLQAVMQNPTPQGFAALTAKYPQQREAFKQSWEILDKGQQDEEFGAGARVFSALQSGKPDIAMAELDQRIMAMENSGQDAGDLKAIRETVRANPQAALGHIGLVMSATDPERWSKMMAESRAAEKAPAELSEAQAKAYKAGVAAKFAESDAALSLEKKGWDIQKLQSDISLGRQNAQIAAMNAAAAREGNDLKRQELQQKIDAAQTKRDDALREKVATIESGRAQIDNMLNTADRVLKTPIDTVEWATGPIGSKVPTTDVETADFEEMVNTLSSQAFMAQIPGLKGMGALSNAEGEKLQSSLQNLSLRQSPSRLIENVREAQRLILKARDNLSTRYGIPNTIPDTPAAQPEASEIDALLQKYGAK